MIYPDVRNQEPVDWALILSSPESPVRSKLHVGVLLSVDESSTLTLSDTPT